MKVIEIRNLNVRYGDVKAVNNLNFQIYEKDFLRIIGPNGDGKSTITKDFQRNKKMDTVKLVTL